MVPTEAWKARLAEAEKRAPAAGVVVAEASEAAMTPRRAKCINLVRTGDVCDGGKGKMDKQWVSKTGWLWHGMRLQGMMAHAAENSERELIIPYERAEGNCIISPPVFNSCVVFFLFLSLCVC